MGSWNRPLNLWQTLARGIETKGLCDTVTCMEKRATDLSMELGLWELFEKS